MLRPRTARLGQCPRVLFVIVAVGSSITLVVQQQAFNRCLPPTMPHIISCSRSLSYSISFSYGVVLKYGRSIPSLVSTTLSKSLASSSSCSTIISPVDTGKPNCQHDEQLSGNQPWLEYLRGQILDPRGSACTTTRPLIPRASMSQCGRYNGR